ncbi:MAG: hypothetical protein SPK64_03105, partial [Candidatus Enterosoma sp.]|nr:hypothetical protein [Candidatus Enterosoma sp.]
QRLRVSVDDSPKFVLAKLADLFYTFHGAVFLSLCFDRLNDKTTAPLGQNFSFLVGTSSNKESHTLLLTSSYLHILYLTTIDWLLDSKKNNGRDENRLKEILNMPDYQIEFERYGLKNLPVCGISYDEAVDFFMNFDKKEFDNQRLEIKKKYFLDFYNNLEERVKTISMFSSIGADDYEVIENLLVNGLPEKILNEIDELNIILIVSIGNSMGWPYKKYIDYDISNLNMFESKTDFLHVTAHEINHIFVGQLLALENIKPEDFFFKTLLMKV